MKTLEPGGGAPSSRPSIEQKAKAAELAAKVAALPHGASSRHGWLWWMCHVCLWLVTLSLLVAAVARIVYHDGTHELTWINAFTRYVYLPAYVCLAWAAWMRRWILSLVALAVVGCHVAWMMPNFVRDRRFDVPSEATVSQESESQTVRIFFANVLATNHDFTPLWKEIENANPDVVVLAESTRFSKDSFRQSPAMAAYVHANGVRKSQSGEVIVYSKLPIKSELQNWVTGRVVQTVDIEVGVHTLRLIGLHAPRPMYPPQYDYFGYWKKMVPLLTSAEGPLVVIGDFNATEHSLVYKQLRDSGLRSAHDDRGRGYATTWPNNRWRLPPIRIDQAFLSPDVECLRVAEGQGEGSDHRPIILDVQIRGKHPAAAEIP
ncbi:MAG: endonuclease/exonuclease/phosphatase family protein [Planctomycetes bacterium]|nr:endonuclease/exonuclease/phosphatase family protein [Planctomycetota bacterium]